MSVIKNDKRQANLGLQNIQAVLSLNQNLLDMLKITT